MDRLLKMVFLGSLVVIGALAFAQAAGNSAASEASPNGCGFLGGLFGLALLGGGLYFAGRFVRELLGARLRRLLDDSRQERSQTLSRQRADVVPGPVNDQLPVPADHVQIDLRHGPGHGGPPGEPGHER